MSTILKALKKLENQRLQSNSAAGSPHRRPDGPGHGFSGDRRFLALVISIAILLASTTTWLATRIVSIPSETPTSSPETADPDIRGRATAPALPQEESVSLGRKKSLPISPKTRTETSPEAPEPSALAPTEQATSALSPIESTTVSILEAEADQVTETEEESSTLPPHRPKPGPEAESMQATKLEPHQPITTDPVEPSQDFLKNGPIADESSPLETVPTLPLLDSSVLKLQAVTWADLPASRFAVLNNKIVRVGDSVEGYRIVTIGEDYVVVEKAGSRWEVRFRPR